MPCQSSRPNTSRVGLLGAMLTQVMTGQISNNQVDPANTASCRSSISSFLRKDFEYIFQSTQNTIQITFEICRAYT